MIKYLKWYYGGEATRHPHPLHLSDSVSESLNTRITRTFCFPIKSRNLKKNFITPIKNPRCSEALSNNQIFYSEGWTES